MIVLDTSELRRPVQRKLHAAWWEIHGEQALVTPAVASELAPLAAEPTGAANGLSAADDLLSHAAPEMTERRRDELRQQAWWATMWRSPESPYRIVQLNDEQQRLTDRLLEKIDRACFPNTSTDDFFDPGDPRIVCEAMATGAKVLLTSDMGSIDRIEVNRWAVENGEVLGFKAEPVVFPADAMLVEWTREQDRLERLVQAGMLACWPGKDHAPANEIIDRTLDGITAMARGDGGKLKDAAGRLHNCLKLHANPTGLVEKTRLLLPSATVETDRLHPTYPHQPQGAAAPPGPAPVQVYRRSTTSTKRAPNRLQD